MNKYLFIQKIHLSLYLITQQTPVSRPVQQKGLCIMILSIDQLAEKLNGNLWTKGELKRIYLDEGHNTKKMSTKTFVWQDESGEYHVSCKVECPSQPWQWCKSQEDEIKTSVARKIENIIAQAQLTLVDYKILTEKPGIMVYVRFANEQPVWYTEENFEAKYGCYPEDLFANLPTVVIPALPTAVPVESNFIPKPIENTATPTYGVGAKVKHNGFGIGVVKAESDKFIEVDFEAVGIKKMILQFVKLEIVTDAN